MGRARRQGENARSLPILVPQIRSFGYCLSRVILEATGLNSPSPQGKGMWSHDTSKFSRNCKLHNWN